jgi:hypothetical protein
MAYVLKDADGAEIKNNGSPVMVMDRDISFKAIDREKRTLVMVGTDETRDRDGDIVSMRGWDVNNYLKNPVFLWSHTYSGPGSVPLGKTVKLVKRSNPARMEFTIQFPSKGVNPFGDMIFDLYDEGIIKASSVGFIAKEYEDVDPTGQTYGKLITKQELLELSGCAVPCNPSALTASVKGYMSNPTDENVEKVMSLITGKQVVTPEAAGVDEKELEAELKGMGCVFVDESTEKDVEASSPEVEVKETSEQTIDNTDENSYLNDENKEVDMKTEETKSEALRTAAIPEGLEAGQLFRLACDPDTGECSLEPITVEDLVTVSVGETEKAMDLNVGQRKALEDAMAIIANVLKEVELPTDVPAETPAPETEEKDVFYDDAGLEAVADAIGKITQQLQAIKEA